DTGTAPIRSRQCGTPSRVQRGHPILENVLRATARSPDRRPRAAAGMAARSQRGLGSRAVAMIEITELSTSESMPELASACIETPRPGDRLTGHVVEVCGWLVGRTRPAVAVELVDGDAVIGRSLVGPDARFTAEAAA